VMIQWGNDHVFVRNSYRLHQKIFTKFRKNKTKKSMDHAEIRWFWHIMS